MNETTALALLCIGIIAVPAWVIYKVYKAIKGDK